MLGRLDETREWLETDGLGGFAMGTATGVRTRRYHALLTTSLRPPADRVALVKGLDAWIETPEGVWGLSASRYADGHVAPDGAAHVVEFRADPWPTWRYRLPTGLMVDHELFMVRGRPVVCAAWRIVGAPAFARITVRPVLGGTDIHSLRREAGTVPLGVSLGEQTCVVRWKAGERLPEVCAAVADGAYVHDPVTYRDVLYTEERARGFDHLEDLESPGVFRWDLTEGEAVMMLSAGPTPETSDREPTTVRARFEAARESERLSRSRMGSRLDRSAEQFLVSRGPGRTIIAGYPWFGDWGRDTFIAMRGVCLARGRWDDARKILSQWAGAVSEGMLPNRFTDTGDTPEFNSVDASLWYVIAAGEYLDAIDGWSAGAGGPDERAIRRAITEILEAYARGTRYHIRCDADGLLAAGEPGVQLTWMDARVNGVEVTPRIGKAVEVQALWARALARGAKLDPKWDALLTRVRASFQSRFWNEERGCLYDVVDVDHAPGRVDPAIRPNQIFAVGVPGLLDARAARAVVDRVERDLFTPAGLRSLAPTEPGYRGRYEGGPPDRDGAYHQGTVWPWLMGPFVEAWVAVRGATPEAAREAHSRFLAPMMAQLDDCGLGGVAEIYDGDAPRSARGCPFQAWSVGELVRVRRLLEDLAGADGQRAGEPAAPPEARRGPAVPYS